jgi:hypothetical protein
LSTEDPRTASSSAQGTRTPPTTFDEISGINAANTLHQTNSDSSRPSTATKKTAADRVSIHGFGSGGVGERARNKGRGRIGIVIGTLYMCAGQWVEAVRELTEGATRARALSDHLWHAKALEHIMVCMLLFAWSGMEFQVCYPLAQTLLQLLTSSPRYLKSAIQLVEASHQRIRHLTVPPMSQPQLNPRNTTTHWTPSIRCCQTWSA